jgi:NitT/TauT family transport system permease protein
MSHESARHCSRVACSERITEAMTGFLARRGGPLLTLGAMIVVWQAAAKLFTIPIYLAPAPSDVVAVLMNQASLLLDDARVTGTEVVLSYCACVMLGIPLGIATVKSRLFARTVYPLLVGGQSVPVVAIAPLAIVWFGLGLPSKIVLAFLMSFFPVVVGTAVGLRAVKPDSIVLARSIGLGQSQTFFKVELPSALPSIFAGMKVATTIAVVGAVVGEFLSSSAGLGFRALVATGTLETPLLFAALVVMMVLGYVSYGAIAMIERLATPWR